MNGQTVNEQLILVDTNDEVLGYDTKANCHQGMGKLHRAFSVLMFTSDGRLLIQQRSAHKQLWPRYWSNSVCSHPRKGEEVEAAARRRLMEELGIDAQLHYLYTFQYHATYQECGSELEMCSVFYGISDGISKPDIEEIEEIEYIHTDRVMAAIDQSRETFTPWFKMEWECIINNCMDRITARMES